MENNIINIFLPVEPKAQQRFRFTRTGIKYKDKTQKVNEECLAYYLQPYVPDKPLECPLMLGIIAYMPIPKSKPKWWKEAAQVGYIRPTSKPDADNLFKNIADVMKTMCFFKDDSQICDATIHKVYSVKGGWSIKLIPIHQFTRKEWEA